MSSDNFRNMLPHPKLCLTFMSSICRLVFYFSDFCSLHWCLLSMLGKMTWVVLVCDLLVLNQQHAALPGLNAWLSPEPSGPFNPPAFETSSSCTYLLMLSPLPGSQPCANVLLHAWGDYLVSEAVQMAPAVDGSVTVSFLLTEDPLSSCVLFRKVSFP